MVYAEKVIQKIIFPTDKMVNMISFYSTTTWGKREASRPPLRKASQQAVLVLRSIQETQSASEGHALLLKEPRKPGPPRGRQEQAAEGAQPPCLSLEPTLAPAAAALSAAR